MKIIEDKVINENIEIQYIKGLTEASNSTPLIIIPGLTEGAEDYIDIMEEINHDYIAISLRGRGKSTSPLTGYSLEDHVGDIEAVIKKENIDECILYGFSRGTSYMLGYALRFPNKVKGIVIGDYPAVHTKLPEKWVEWFAGLPPWRGKATLERMSKHALEGIQKESTEKEFWTELKAFNCPILIIGGKKAGAVLTDEMISLYKESIENCEVELFEDSDHNLYAPNAEKFAETICRFLDKV